MKFYLVFVIFFIIGVLRVHGQSDSIRLSLSELIDMALKKNPSVQIMHNNITQAGNNYSLQPFLPQVDAIARYNLSHTDSKRIFQDSEQEFPNTYSENMGVGVSLSWRIFDGLGMFASFKHSRLNVSVEEVEKRRVVEALVVDLSETYYRIVVQQHRVEAAKQLMNLSRERFRIITEQVNIGSASGMDLHQARLDLNADSSYLVRQNEILHNAYIEINQLINQPLRRMNFISDTIFLGSLLVEDDLILMVEENNSALISEELGVAMSSQELKMAKAQRFPIIDFVTGYNYSRAETPASVMQFSEANGYNYGLEASLNIFNGFEVGRTVKNNKLEIQNRKLSYEETYLMVMGELHSLYATYLNNLMMVDFEKQNVAVALANLDLALERYELGVLSGLGFREFQLGYINATDRFLDGLYQSKVLELSLLVLSGQMDEFMIRIN